MCSAEGISRQRIFDEQKVGQPPRICVGNTQEILGTQLYKQGCPNAVVGAHLRQAVGAHLKQARKMTSSYYAGMEHIARSRRATAPARRASADSDQLSPIARAAWYVEDAFSGNFEEDMDSRTNAQRDALCQIRESRARATWSASSRWRWCR